MKVAFNRTKITPKDYIGKPMAGYSRKDPCLGKLDDIHAYGVLLNIDSSNNKHHLLMISVDILKLPLSIVEYIKKRLISKFELLKTDEIFLHATHTHSSFDLTGEFYYPGGALGFIKGVMFADNKNDRFIVWMTNRIVRMVSKLFEDLEPCTIAWKKESFNPDIVLNRRWPTRNVLPDLGIIAFKKLEDSKLIGIIINYSCHPTTLSHKNNKLSADFPGRVISKIDDLTSGSVKTIYFNGPSGDLNPITTSGTNLDKIDKDKKLSYDQLGTYKHTKKIGHIIGEEALKVAKSIPEDDYSTIIEVDIYTKKLLIPQKDAKYYSKVWFSNKVKWVLKKYFLFKIAKFDYKFVNFPFFTVERKNLKNYGKTVVHFIKLTAGNSNTFGILTIPGELFEDLGENLVSHAPTKMENTLIFQNTQDWIGYLFPLEMYIKEGGYEPFMCFSPLCGAYVENNAKKLLKEIIDTF
ncbi:MAG: hypothetical protein E3J90_00275 [Promethearchaeota archaeon]|nr:MAG: hypothetical protein E3J90_00275 [Candidatus Lokiarchaeota archaeon]